MIKQHRKYKDMTLEELARDICSVSYLSKIEHNTIRASDEIYQLLGERLKIKLVDINQTFDEAIYKDLLDWHDATQLHDIELMGKFEKKAKAAFEENHNSELLSLYKIVKARHDMKVSESPLPEETVKELDSIYPHANKEYKFFYHKTIGIQCLLVGELKEALQQFIKTHELLQQVPFEDSETYFHLCLAYAQTKSPVESNYYGEKALEGYKHDLNYTRMIDTYMIIAVNYRYLNIYHLAEEYSLKLLKVGKYSLPQHDLRRIYHNLGFIYANQEKYEKALDALLMAKEIDTPEKYFEISTIHLLASTSYYNGDFDKCWSYIQEGEKQAEEHNQLYYKHKFYVLEHKLNGDTHKSDFIKKLEEVIIPDTRKLNEYEEYKDLLEMLGDIYYEKRMYKKAAMNYKEANQYKFTQKKDLL